MAARLDDRAWIEGGWWREFVSTLPARTGKLAVVRADGSPHVVPVWFESADSVKGKAILRDPRVRVRITRVIAYRGVAAM